MLEGYGYEMTRLIIIGASGQLGTDLETCFRQASSSYDVVPLTHKTIELRDHNGVHELLTDLNPGLVLNTAAFHQVDQCETEAESAFRVNALGVRNLAEICSELGATLLHVSTDYVFGGEHDRRSAYREMDTPQPINVYGNSKLAGEYFVQSIAPKHFIVRSSGLFGIAGSSGKGGNFIETMLRLASEGREIKVVNDQRLSPTFTRDLAAKIAELIQSEEYGLYHLTSTGDCTWYEFASEIFQQAHIKANLSPTTTDGFGARARRPRYSVLESERLEEIGLEPIRIWQEALREYLGLRESSTK